MQLIYSIKHYAENLAVRVVIDLSEVLQGWGIWPYAGLSLLKV